jgi:hypothetical protein|tara:strand:+ start:1766 stop:1951 length:186 start_codon:yes stop_codon:yes gene_type:complete
MGNVIEYLKGYLNPEVLVKLGGAALIVVSMGYTTHVGEDIVQVFGESVQSLKELNRTLGGE